VPQVHEVGVSGHRDVGFRQPVPQQEVEVGCHCSQREVGDIALTGGFGVFGAHGDVPVVVGVLGVNVNHLWALDIERAGAWSEPIQKFVEHVAGKPGIEVRGDAPRLLGVKPVDSDLAGLRAHNPRRRLGRRPGGSGLCSGRLQRNLKSACDHSVTGI